MFISKVSPTKLDTIKECYLKYYLRYHERLVGDQTKNEDALNFGSYVHKIFEEGYTATDKKDLYKLAEKHKETYKVSYQYEPQIKKCIDNFFDRNNRFGETIGCEYEFNVALSGDITLNGYIDRIIRGTEGGILVIDYKTSKREKTKFQLKFNKQLKNYCYAAHKEFDVPIHKIVCAHYYPLTDNLVSVTFSKGEILSHIKDVVQTVWTVRKKKKNEFPPVVNDFCRWCDFYDVCPAHNPPEKLTQALVENARRKEEEKSKAS